MKFRYENIVTVFALSFLVAGCATDQTYKIEKPHLYSISKGSSKGYLFGTMHVAVATDDLPEYFWSYFDSAQVYLYEYISSDKTEGDRTQKMPQYTKTFNLENYFSAEEISKLKDEMKFYMIRYKIDFSEMYLEEILHYFQDKAEEQLAASPQVEVPRGEYIRIQKGFLLDLNLMDKTNSKKSIQYSLDEDDVMSKILQCYYSDKKALAQKIKIYLNNTVPNTRQNLIAKVRRIRQIYSAGTESIFDDIEPANRGFDKCLLDDRNIKWMPKIRKNLDQNKVIFIAVGARHLYGENGLISLLKADGFSVERVSR